MQRETAQQLREQTLEQLYKQIGERQKELQEVRFKLANRELKDTASKARIRKHIAKIVTIIQEKESLLIVSKTSK